MAVRNGNNNSNFLFGTFGSDEMNGRGGNDLMFGLFGNDLMRGGNGNDLMFGGWGNDRIRGGNGDDLMFGGSGNDRIRGGNGDDVAFGGSGNDRLVGGRGSDVMFGGSGNDTFVYRADRNVGETDFYSGGSGNDRLVIRLNEDEAANEDIQADIAAFEAFIEEGGRGNFTFDSLGLTVNGIERLRVIAPDPVPNENTAPIVSGPVDLGAIDEDTSNFFSIGALLAGASDADGDQLSVMDVAVTSENATVRFDDGGYIVTPEANDDSEVTLSYTISDGQGGLVNQTATLDLTPVNDAPVVSGPVDLGESPEDTTAFLLNGLLLANTVDADGDALTVKNLTVTSQNGEIVLGDQNYEFVPSENFNGTATFSYDVSDGLTDLAASAFLEITPVNDAPVAEDDGLSIIVLEGEPVDLGNPDDEFLDVRVGQSLEIEALVNDSDVDTGDTLTISGLTIDPDLAARATITTDGDTITFLPNIDFFDIGEVVVLPDDPFIGDGDIIVPLPPISFGGEEEVTFEYTVSDGDDVDTASVTVLVYDHFIIDELV